MKTELVPLESIKRYSRNPRINATEGAVAIGRGVQIVADDGSRLGVVPPRDDAHLRTVSLSGDSILLHGATACTDVWRVKKVNPQSMVHLTEKPVELAARAILYSSRRGENVLDLFGGSGSTLIGAQTTERKAYLMELDPLYCDVIVQRWEKFSGGKARLERLERRSQNGSPRRRRAG